MSASASITPILLAGGVGTRLWPVSRASRPKQFTPVDPADPKGGSLFQAVARRLSGQGVSPEGNAVTFAAPIAVTAEAYRFVVAEQLAAIEQGAQAILLEPAARNTAPAILAAALWQAARDPQALMLAAPSDHRIPDAAAFRAAVATGADAARAGRIVTFGVAPDRPETGYGYLELADPSDGAGPRPLARFIEKPDAARAEALLAGGRCLWNAGVFLFRADVILARFEAVLPGMVRAVEAALETAEADLGFLRLGAEAWEKTDSISVDYAIMEQTPDLAVVPFTGAWSDLGDWDAAWRSGVRDGDGVTCQGAATALACRDTLLRSDEDGLHLIGVGLEDIVAVATRDAVLVADRRQAQAVRAAVETLAERGVAQATDSARAWRPWGWFETLCLGPRFQVKRIMVKPGGRLSLQSHVHRSEHWVVVAGTAEVTIGDRVELVTENQSVYVPLGVTHRLANPGRVPMYLIEVQTGAYLGEDDIDRLDDAYNRD